MDMPAHQIPQPAPVASRSARFASTCVVSVMALVTAMLVGGCHNPNGDLQPITVGLSTDPNVMSTIANAGPTTIQPGDEIVVSVLQDERLSGTYRIDNDGGFQWHYVGRVKTDSLTTNDLRRKLADVASTYINEPSVTVNYVSQQPPTIRVLGQANTQGLIALKRGWRLMDAIAAVGGPTRDANWNEVVLVRSVSPTEIRAGIFNYREAMLNPLGDEWRNNIMLEKGDTIFFATSGRAQWESAIQFVNRLGDAIVGVERSIVLYPDVESVISTGETEGQNTIVVR